MRHFCLRLTPRVNTGAWGVAGMAAAGRARNLAALTRTQQQIVAQASSAGSATNPEAAVVGAVFTGAFLDTKSSAVFGVFFVIGCYFFAVVQVKAPKLKLFALFGTIVLTIMAMYGPLFPAPRYTLATIFMLPIGVSLGYVSLRRQSLNRTDFQPPTAVSHSYACSSSSPRRCLMHGPPT